MFFLCSILFQIIFIFDVIAAKRKMPNDPASYSNRQNKSALEEGYTLFPGWCHPFSKMTTPFAPNGVAILQITSLVLLHYIISFIQLHGQFCPITSLVLGKQMVYFKENEDSLCWKSLFDSSVCQRNSHNDIFMLVKQGYQCHCSCLLTMGMLRLYIGRVASIYRACCIYISDASHLYIQRHPYIDARR